MKFRQLGRSGLQISEIAYGNWITHGSQIDDDRAVRCVHAALDEGITTFDTADVYAGTAAESVLGKALKGQRRESLVLSTKVFFPLGPGPNDGGLARKHITEGINGSLSRLGTDYVDLYQAHRFDHRTPLEETLKTFDDLIRQGKVLYIGVSEWTADQITRAMKLAAEMGLDRFVSNQPQYSMLWRVIEEEVVPVCEREGMSQIVWSPLAQGVLTGKYLPGQPLPAGSRATDEVGSGWVKTFLRDDVLERVQQLAAIAAELGLTQAQLALAWTLQNPNVAAAIVGASRPEQVRDSAKAAGVRLDEDVMRRIDAVLGPVVERDPAKVDGAE
ncbi:aldo/keto reductase family protein [Streptomyces luteolus]|uniref:Aldo/keto reductase family protein n=1 Tax=Streptomyces luteolus TaxID=3043615 RepID=A0ABT6SYW5_9ACTN|nr:aldo/keto reductase family protein [Streptomyces sp. B-S-A12]MDI3420385.1 aldo/keto reductase family protein [Streptomyces sp. B-S-A12]